MNDCTYLVFEQPLGMYHYHTGVKHCVIAWMDSRLQTAC